MVALDPRTEKALWAKEHRVFLVHPRWVDAACYLWRRPPEEDYPVTNDASGQTTKSSFSKSVVVEPRGGGDGTSDKGEGAGPSPSAGVPPVHVNGSSGASSG